MRNILEFDYFENFHEVIEFLNKKLSNLHENYNNINTKSGIQMNFMDKRFIVEGSSQRLSLILTLLAC